MSGRERIRAALSMLTAMAALGASGPGGMRAAAADEPAAAAPIAAGSLLLELVAEGGGIRLERIHDVAADQERIGTGLAPALFTLTLRHAETREEVSLDSASGWHRAGIDAPAPDGSVTLRWAEPRDERLGPLAVSVHIRPDAAAAEVSAGLEAAGQAAPWSLWQVTFPQIALREPGNDGRVFYPRGCGQVETGVWDRPFTFRDKYPGGWTGMQYLAAYDGEGAGGLYLAVHDPFGSPKQLAAVSRPEAGIVTLAFEHPVPDMGRPGNRFELCGDAVLRLFRGDWFDAALIYRAWARQAARWYPALSHDGRADTPRWMRELPVWVMTGGAPAECEAAVAGFARDIALPVGFHWYNWHQIPFDNDYPHYFPTKDGIAEAVARLQQAGVHVMPYINGRLWDTRDEGDKDAHFTSVALPAATKEADGSPQTETYGSKEADGTPVRLAVMCPATRLWRDRVSGIVARLFGEVGVDAVYIDQVAAATPVLCFDPGHGHPLGGGHWWTEGYWHMLDQIRQARPPERVLTTECNAEPYVRWFDGYLTWHWQYDGQVPAFPAVYGGAIQMFGRAYRGGDTKDLALRMKAGQQLVFGEQIGWFDPGVLQEPANAAFLRQVIDLRWRLRRYFHAGEMARPPRLRGELARLRADWQWSGTWFVETDAVLTGAWRLPGEKRLALLLVNAGDAAFEGIVEFDLAEAELAGATLALHPVATQAAGEQLAPAARLARACRIPPRTAVAWELAARAEGE